jgi:hypothetical protein
MILLSALRLLTDDTEVWPLTLEGKKKKN